MNIKYLGNHAKRISHIRELTEGEMYVVGRGRDAFIAFVMPEEKKINRIREDSYTFVQIPVYEASLKHCGQEIESEQVDIDDVHIDEFLDVELMGVFRPTPGSKLRKTIEEKFAEKRVVAETQ
ncbi:MAG TPA: hypothetical protein VJ438_05170 [Candidatus Nanoarchaeia archaeon]|nr:hypothetical protein [Candidatus Nanoarchaeia archaeon]